MRNSVFASTLLLLAILPSLAAAHGGSYTGPPSSPGPGSPATPPGPTPAAPGGPTTGGERITAGDPTLWQHWWTHNQAPYLQLKSHVHAADQGTGSGDYWLGQGQRNDLDDALRVSDGTIQDLIVPSLLQALRTESSKDIQSSCMIALAKIGNPDGGLQGSALARESRFEIRKRLVSPNQELSETAAIALGITASPENIAVLTAVLENDLARLRSLGVPQLDNVNLRTRAFAAYGLGLIGCRANEYQRLVINATLRKLLDGEARSMAQSDIPVACLVSIGLSPLPVARSSSELEVPGRGRLAEVMTSRQDQLRFLLECYADRARNTLTRAQAPTAMARLLALADVPSSFVLREQVAETLMRDLAADSKADNAMQQSCILALGELGDCDEDPLDRQIRATLMRVKAELADQQARFFALIALAHAAGRPGHGLGNSIHGVESPAAKDNARTFLLGELAREKSNGRQWAALALAILERSLEDAGKAPAADVRLALRSSLKQARGPDDLGAFAIACGVLRDRGASELLLEDLQSLRDAQARGHAAIALGMIGERAAIPLIEDLARQSKYQPDLLRSAAIALGLLDDKQVVPELIDMLGTASSLSSQAAIGSALGMIGDYRSVPALIELLRNNERTQLARAFGAVALGIVADKEALPWNSKIGVGSNYRVNTPSLTDGTSGVLDIL